MPPAKKDDTQVKEENTEVTSEGEGDITYVEEGDTWVQVDTRGGREKRTVWGTVTREQPATDDSETKEE